MLKKIKGGDSIGRIVIIEFAERDSGVFDEVMEFLSENTSFEKQQIKETKTSLPGLAIHPRRRLVYCNNKGISGTNTKRREGFNRMVADALDGKIDLILTKSISRFARNTVDTLTTVRKLKEWNVEVYFEKKDFYTGKVPKNAVKSAFFGTVWCLGGV